MKEVVIVSAVRTPIGSFGGSLKEISARTLGAIAIKEAIKRVDIAPEMIDEVIFGCVLQGGMGQNIARQTALDAGIPEKVPAMTLNKVCGSGLRTVSLAAQIIKAGDADIIVAGGTENMSDSRYAIPSARWGARMNDSKMIDLMTNDGLICAINNYHMGITAENVSAQWNITKEELDEFAVNSQQKALCAVNSGRFKDEIVPVIIPQKKHTFQIFDTDEYPKEGITMEKIANLKPAFKKEGIITAANSSGINDAAAALIIMSKCKANELGIKPLCTIKSYASAGVDPSIMGVAPVFACRKALNNADMTIEQIDLIESNEAFAAQAIVVGKELGFDMSKVNVNGGAIALGHPIGASGARILVSLIHEMMKRDVRVGLATLCIGGGQGTSLIVERET